MLKIKIKMTVTDADGATDNASPDAINTAPHAPNSSTASYTAACTAEIRRL